MGAQAAHPSAEMLHAYRQGQLNASEAEGVRSHLTACTACREKIAEPGLSMTQPHEAAVSGLAPELAASTKYRVLRELGRGGMGVVYQAQHTRMERTVALKVMNPAVLAFPGALERFDVEVKAAAKLEHPNIVRAYDAEQLGNLHILVMEYVEGQSLSQVVKKKGPLPMTHACHYARQAALGLQHAHEKGMAHRDVKPANLMLTPKGVVKILDFGLARLRGNGADSGGLTASGAFIGTPEYVAPEQALDARRADIRSDLYSLGGTLYFC